MKIRVDKRQVEFQRQPEADRIATEACARMKEDQILLAKALRTMWSTAAYVGESCSGVGDYVLRRGLSPFQGMDLLYVGIAMAAYDWVEPGLRDGSIPIHYASQLGRVCALSGAIDDDDEWHDWVRFLSYRRLRSIVGRRVEEVKQRTKDLHRFTTCVTRQALEDFAEARVLASRKEGRALTKGETFAFVSRDFRKRHDPTFRKAGKRRVGDTSDPSCRTIPAETIRACEDVYGDQCWAPGCQHRIFLQHVHIESNHEGGSQEPENVGRGCHTHHVLYDAGKMWIIGTNARGLPVFETAEELILHPDFPSRTLKKSAVQAGAVGEVAQPPPTKSPTPTQRPERPRPGAKGSRAPVWREVARAATRRGFARRLRCLALGRARCPGDDGRLGNGLLGLEIGSSHLRGPPRASSP